MTAVLGFVLLIFGKNWSYLRKFESYVIDRVKGTESSDFRLWLVVSVASIVFSKARSLPADRRVAAWVVWCAGTGIYITLRVCCICVAPCHLWGWRSRPAWGCPAAPADRTRPRPSLAWGCHQWRGCSGDCWENCWSPWTGAPPSGGRISHDGECEGPAYLGLSDHPVPLQAGGGWAFLQLPAHLVEGRSVRSLRLELWGQWGLGWWSGLQLGGDWTGGRRGLCPDVPLHL